MQVTIKGSEGYIAVRVYVDQLTAGARNILGLQCLASWMGGIAVIEPSLSNSYYGIFNVDWYNKRSETVLNFGHLYDIAKWNRLALSLHYSPLVPVEHLLENIRNNNTKYLIVVEYNCVNGSKEALTYGSRFASKLGLKFVKHVCFNFMRTVHFSQFKRDVYSGYAPNEVVVLFNRYGGIENEKLWQVHKHQRIYISGTQCHGHDNFVFEGLYPSQSVMSDAEKYLSKYMNGSRTYISVMVRIEKSLINMDMFSEKKAEAGATKCVQNVIKRWRTVQKQYNIHSTFLTVDVGKFGSDTFRFSKINKTSLIKAAEHLFLEAYGGTLTLEMWEQTFTTIGGGKTKSPAYIALMQKVLAAKGTVLITAGGGTFHKSTQELHRHFQRIPKLVTLGPDCS